jgi:hypothetical protein
MVLHRVILTSNASTKAHPQNTLTNFTNILPDGIRTSSKRPWFVALQALSVHAEFYGSKPDYIRVVMPNLRSSATPTCNGRTLAILPFYEQPNQVHGFSRYFYHESDVCEFAELSGGNIDSLSLRLLDQDGHQLNVVAGQPTFARLVLKRMRPSSNLSLRVSSLDTTSVGSNSNFTVQLGAPLTLSGDWQAALSSIQFPKNFSAVSEDDLTGQDRMEVVFGRHRNMHTGAFTRSDFTSPESVVNAIVIHLAMAGEQLEQLLTVTLEEGGSGKIVVGAYPSACIAFSHRLAVLLGLVEPLDGGKRQPVMLDATDLAGAGLTPAQVLELDPLRVTGKHSVNLQTPATMLLYSDMIKPTMFGDRNVQILKLVPTDQGLGETTVSYECRHLDFAEVNSDHIMSISFVLRRFDGKLIEFTKENSEVLYNIVFRKVIKKRRRKRH